MENPDFSDEFKRDAVYQIVVRGNRVGEVSKRSGVSTHALYQWMQKFPIDGAKPQEPDQSVERARLKRALARVTEARYLKKGNRIFRKEGHISQSRSSPF